MFMARGPLRYSGQVPRLPAMVSKQVAEARFYLLDFCLLGLDRLDRGRLDNLFPVVPGERS
jgi:hypothetical protein